MWPSFYYRLEKEKQQLTEECEDLLNSLDAVERGRVGNVCMLDELIFLE